MPDQHPLPTERKPRSLRDSVDSIRRMIAVVMTVLLFTVIYFARELLLPVVIGLVIALTLSPLTRGLSARGVPAPIAAALIFFSFFAFFAIGGFAAGTQIADWADNLPQVTQEIEAKLNGLFASVETVQEISARVDEVASGGETPEKVVVAQPGLLTNAVSGVASVGTSFLAGSILALLLLGAGRTVNEKLIANFPRLADKKRALKIAHDIQSRISRYLLTISLINLVLGILVGIWLYLIGLPYAAAWGLLAGALNFLPYVGGVVGVVMVGTFGLISFEDLTPALLGPLGYFLLNALEGQLVTPYLLGRNLRLNTVSVFLAVMLWAWLWEIPGALLAVPVLVSFKVMCDNVDSMRWLGVLLGSTDDEIEVEPRSTIE